MKLALLLAVAGALVVPAAVNAADRGFYAGAGIGEINVEVDDVLGSSYRFDEKELGLKAFAGYKFFPWLSVEGIFLDGGDPEVTFTDPAIEVREALSISVQSFVGAAVFAWPITPTFELFIKPGLAYWKSTTDYRLTVGDQSDGFSERDDGTAFFIGAGAGFTSGNAVLRLEYEWFDVAPEYDNDADEFVDELDASAGFISLSVVYVF